MGGVAVPRHAGHGTVRVMVRAESSQYTNSTDGTGCLQYTNSTDGTGCLQYTDNTDDSDDSDGSDGSDYTVLHGLELGPVVQR